MHTAHESKCDKQTRMPVYTHINVTHIYKCLINIYIYILDDKESTVEFVALLCTR